MVRRAGFVAAWIVATFATGLVAWSAVRVAGSQVSEQAVRPLSAAEVESLPLATLTGDGALVTSVPAPSVGAGRSTTTLPGPVGPGLAPAVSSSTTTPPGTASTTTTRPATPPTSAVSSASSTSSTTATAPTSSTSTTVTTAAAAPPEVRTYQTGGGSVTIRVSPGVVELGAASPAAGFAVEVEDSGPQRVKVKFESTSGAEDQEEYEFSARWDGDDLVVEID